MYQMPQNLPYIWGAVLIWSMLVATFTSQYSQYGTTHNHAKIAILNTKIEGQDS